VIVTRMGPKLPMADPVEGRFAAGDRARLRASAAAPAFIKGFRDVRDANSNQCDFADEAGFEPMAYFDPQRSLPGPA
jgi:hypothetical protein